MIFENMLSMPTEEWNIWLIMGGRGLGKTTSAAFHISNMVKNGTVKNVAFIGRTIPDVLNTMVYNGIMKFMPQCKVDVSRKAIKNENGEVMGYYFSQRNPYKIRGFSFDFAWIDEISTFDRNNIHELWNNLLLCLRVGISKIIITTTPSSLDLLRDIMSEYKTYLTTGTSYENSFLSSTFINHISNMQQNAFYKEEVIGEISNNFDLWSPADVIYCSLPSSTNILYVLGIDPAVTVGTTGIILTALCDDRAYVIADYSISCPIRQWIKIVYDLSLIYCNLQIVLEINQGGQALKDILQITGIKCPILTQYARESKYQRNLKSYSLYESNLVFHVSKMENLEKEMFYKPKDRVDALTWSLMPLYERSNSFSVDIIYGY